MRVLVAGGTGGIGASIVTRLGKDGHKIVSVSRRGVARPTSADGCSYFSADLRDAAACTTLREEVHRSGGPVDGFVHAVGNIYDQRKSYEIPWSRWQESFDLCLGTAVNLASAFAPDVEAAKGSAVFISSVASTHTYPGIADYCAAKAALEAFVRALAIDLAPSGARANAVCPAVIDTPLFRRSPYTVEEANSWHRLGRVGTPGDVAGLVSWLISDESEWMTGSALRIDGGMLL